MSLFNNNKLFLDLNFDLIDTKRVFALDGIVLDKQVAKELNLSKIRINFVKNKINNQTENEYFTNEMSVPSHNILVSNLSRKISNIFLAENSDYELNKITKYTDVPGNHLFFDHEYSQSKFITNNIIIEETDLSKGNYHLDFISLDPLGMNADFLRYYINNPYENIKFYLTAYDKENNLIDSCEIIKLENYNSIYLASLEYDEIFARFNPTVLRTSTDIKVTDEGFLVKNYAGDFREPGANKTHFDLDTPSISGTTFRRLVKYPNLNAAYIKFIINEDGTNSAWVLGGAAKESDNVGFSLDGIIDNNELKRFNIYRDNKKKVKLRYISNNINDSLSDLVIELDNNGTWENSYSFFESNNPTFREIILRDYQVNNSFNFLVEVPYKIQSYISTWDINFTETKKCTLEKTDVFNRLIRRLLQSTLIEELNKYYVFKIETRRRNFSIQERFVEKEVLKLDIERTESLIENSSFINPLERAKNPILVEINQVLDNNSNIKSTLNSENQIFKNEDLITNPVNVGTNSYLQDLVGSSHYFNLNHRQNLGVTNTEIFGEIILKIRAFYNGEEVEINYPIDIAGGIYLNEGSYIRNLLPSPQGEGIFSISFKNNNNENPNIIDFDIKINKQKADNLSKLLQFGNKANIPDQNDLESPSLLEKLLLEIDYVKHIFNVETIENNLRFPVTIVKSPTQFRNFNRNKNDYIELSNHYVLENLILNNENLGATNTSSSDFPTQESMIIINDFLNNNIRNLIANRQLVAIDYHIEVKFRSFIFPKGLNQDYPLIGDGDLANITYSNINTTMFNQDITNNVKYRIFNYAYEANPSSNKHYEVVTKWLSRNFNNNTLDSSSTYHNNLDFVKNYFMGNKLSNGFLKTKSNKSGLDHTFFKMSRNTIGSHVNKLNGNYDYDLLIENNVSDKATISVQSNVKAIIKSDLSGENQSRGRFGNLSIELKPQNAANKSKTTFTLTSDNDLIWDSNEISKVEVVFIPEIVNYNIKSELKELNSASEIQNISLRNALYIGHQKGKEGNINLKPRFVRHCEYSVKNNQKSLEIKIDTSPNTGSTFSLDTFLNRSNSDAGGFIDNGNHFTTQVLSIMTQDQSRYFNPSLLNKTLIVRDFMYRIKIVFNDNSILYKNYKVPVTGQSSLIDLISKDPLRIETLFLDYHKKNNSQISPARKRKIEDGVYSEKLYNLAFMPYRVITRNKIKYNVYGSVKLLNLPGYKVR